MVNKKIIINTATPPNTIYIKFHKFTVISMSPKFTISFINKYRDNIESGLFSTNLPLSFKHLYFNVSGDGSISIHGYIVFSFIFGLYSGYSGFLL